MNFHKISMASLIVATLAVGGCHEKQKTEQTSLPAAQSKQTEPPKDQMHESEKVPVQSSDMGSNTQPNSGAGSITDSYESEVEADGVSYIPPIDSGSSSSTSETAISASAGSANIHSDQSSLPAQVGETNVPTIPSSSTAQSTLSVQETATKK